MKIMIHREGQEYGPYTIEEAKAHLADGTLVETDMTWVEGGTEWVPLKTVLSSGAGQTTPGAPPPPPVEEKPHEMNLLLVGGLFVGAILVLIPIVLLVVAPGWMGKLVSSNITIAPVSVTAGATSSAGSVTSGAPSSMPDGSNYAFASWMQQQDVIVVDLKTDYTGDKLRDKVLEQIYSAATDKDVASATKIELSLHVTATLATKNATIKIDDLGPVRASPDKEAYRASSAREVIDADLNAAGL